MQLVNALSSNLQNIFVKKSERFEKLLTKKELVDSVNELSKDLPQIKIKMQKYKDSNVESYRIVLDQELNRIIELSK